MSGYYSARKRGQPSFNFDGVRLYATNHPVKMLDISPLGNGKIKLSILFENMATFHLDFASIEAASKFVYSWKSANGCPLWIDGIRVDEPKEIYT